MSRARDGFLIGVVALAAAIAGFGYNAWRTAPDEGPASGETTIAAMTFADLDGKPQGFGQWRGKVVVVNFWATWCAPCREEIPLLVKLQEKYRDYGLQLVGVAIDQPEKVRPYALEMGMNFPILIGSLDAIDLTKALGNRAGVLPFTVVVGRDGKIAKRHVGIVKQDTLEPLLTSLMSQKSIIPGN